MTNPEFSVIVPVYNSAANLKQLLTDISKVFNNIGRSYEVVLVNDHSPDNSLQVLMEVKKGKSLPIAVFDLKKNMGQYVATVIGIAMARGEYLITLDADFNPLLIKLLIEGELQQDVLVYGELIDANRSFLRKKGSRIFNALVKLNLNKKVAGSGSSFRLMSKSLADKALKNLSEPALLDIKLINASGNVSFVRFSAEVSRNSTYSLFKLIKTGLTLVKGIMFERLYLRKTFVAENMIRKQVS